MDVIEAIGFVRVTKTDKETGEVVFDQLFKNKITNYARTQAALLWSGAVVNTPAKIAVGTGTNAAGPQASDTALWSEVSGSRKILDFSSTFLNYYTQFGVTYQQTEVLASSVINFSDALTEYSGSTSANWTNSGTVTYGTSGATLGSASASILSKSATNMDPVVGSAVTVQATVLTPNSNPNDFVHLYQDGSNFYEVYTNGGQFKIAKTVAGVHTVLVASSVLTFTANSSYTFKVTIDSTGLITASIYAGTSATGTAMATISFTDTSLPGPYTLKVGGDSGAVITNAQATYPNPDTTQSISLSECGLFDNAGNLWSHVALTGVTHDNTTTLSIQWQVLHQGN